MEAQDRKNTGSKVLSRKLVAGSAIVLLAGIGLFIFLNRPVYRKATPTFVGDSNDLEQTVVVPTLDTPRPTGKNVIWCSSFQLSWKEIMDKVTGGPLPVLGAEDVASRLNAGGPSATDLDPQSVYVGAGRVGDGIITKIKKDMASKFPGKSLPDFSMVEGGRDAIAAYSFLTANVPFKYPFRQRRGGLTFTDYQGIQTNASSFGLWSARSPRYDKICEQVEVLHYRLYEPPDYSKQGPRECVVDLCKHSRPYQVVLALVPPKDSLAETLEYVKLKTEEFKQRRDQEAGSEFREHDWLLVPDMYWRIDHRFKELIGKMVANVGTPIVEAMQTIEFRLDRSGAMIESHSLTVVSAWPREFIFNQPFLVYVKKRDADRPFFVMWVDNAELLVHE